MYRYRTVELPCALAAAGRRLLYGLLAEQYVRGRWVTVAITADLSCDKTFVERLAQTCTRLQLNPIHLLDVLLDALP